MRGRRHSDPGRLVEAVGNPAAGGPHRATAVALGRRRTHIRLGVVMGIVSNVLRRGSVFAVTLLASACGVQPASPPTHDQAAASNGWTQVWRDDFTGPAGNLVSSARWRYDTGRHYPGGSPGWGNNEV